MAMFWSPLSQAIVFGLTFATLLTLIATPAMLALPVVLKERLQGLRRQQRHGKEIDALEAPLPVR